MGSEVTGILANICRRKAGLCTLRTGGVEEVSINPKRHRMVGRSRWNTGSRDTEAIGGRNTWTIESAKKPLNGGLQRAHVGQQSGVCVSTCTCVSVDRDMRRACGDCGPKATRASLKNGFSGLAPATHG